MKKILSLLLLACACAHSFAAIVPAVAGKITSLYSYNQYGGGDVVFTVETPLAGCEGGFYLSKSDAGFQANFAMLLSAFHTKNPITTYALSDQIWGGSSAKTCKVYMVQMH